MLLSIKLGAPVNMHQRRMDAILADVLAGISQAKNRAITEWYVKTLGTAPEKLQWDKSYYHVCRSAARHVNSNVISSACSELMDSLKSRVPYNHAGKSKYRWQAILANEISLPTFKDRSFPVPVSSYRVAWEGRSNRPAPNLRSDSTCVAQIPLLSREAGAKVRSPIMRLLVGDLGNGHKDILRRLLDPDDSLVTCDSRMSLTDKGWIFRLTYKDTAELPALSKISEGDRVVTVLPNGHEERNPIVIVLPDGRKRYTGYGHQIIAERTRVLARRAVLQAKYRDAGQGGHGRQRYFARQRPVTRGWENFTDRIEKLVIADIVKACRDSQAIGVVYREPTMPLRNWDWFGRKGMPWAWSEFELKLRAKLTWERLCYEKKRIGCAEYRDLYRLSDMPSADQGDSAETA